MECLLREFQVRRVSLPVYDPDRESLEVSRAKKRKLGEDGAEVENKSSDPECSFLTGLPLVQMPGHTGYLTFATLPAQPSDTNESAIKSDT